MPIANVLLKYSRGLARWGLLPQLVLLLTLVVGRAASAHEFWLEASNYRPKVGAKIELRTRNGMNYKGNSLPFVSGWFHKFQIIEGGKARPVDGVEGDDPAATPRFKMPGLAIMTYFGKPDSLAFTSWEKFKSYLALEGLDQIEAQHKARGLPETQFRETYSRCAKALVAVGDGKAGLTGDDRATGMPLELVALRNPYRLAAGQPLPVQLLFRGKPLGGVTIKVFNSKDPKKPLRVITGTDGRALIPLAHRAIYMLNAVHMFEPPKDAKEEWTSLWASLTFAR